MVWSDEGDVEDGVNGDRRGKAKAHRDVINDSDDRIRANKGRVKFSGKSRILQLSTRDVAHVNEHQVAHLVSHFAMVAVILLGHRGGS